MTDRKEEKSAYQVLSRRWRPKVFEEIIGQEHVTTCLMNAIETGRLGHAYLFCGSRGVGKTTTARVFARAINCEKGPRRNPCNECTICKEMLVGTNLDFLEIDGASNRGIDEVRDLREKIKYATAGGKYRIYVIDEVHALTEHAFNALLKTLEEPPAHVIFIMATTAPQKLPATIISRCQRFDFRRIFPEEIVERMKNLSRKENFSIDDEALSIIAKKAEGSVRDGESMLDQIVTVTEGTVKAETVRNFLGIPREDVFFEITEAILDGKPKETLKIVEGLYKEGQDLNEFASSLTEHLRNLLLISIDPSLAGASGILKNSVPGLIKQSSRTNDGDLVRLIRILNTASYLMKKSPVARLHLELGLVEMANLDSTKSVKELIERLEAMEGRILEEQVEADGSEKGARSDRSQKEESESEGGQSSRRGGGASHSESGEGASETKRGSHSSSPPPESTGKWEALLLSIKKRKTSLWSFLSEGKVVSLTESELVVELPRDRKFHREQIENKINRGILLEEIKKIFGKPLSLKVVDGEVTEISESSPFEDETVKTIAELFDGEIVKKEKR